MKKVNDLYIASPGNLFLQKRSNIYFGETLRLESKITDQGKVVPETIDDYEEVPNPLYN